jgi:hypothetical protein
MTYLLLAPASVYLLWILYVAVMGIKRARDAGTISRTALALGYPVLFVGLALDALVNVCVFSFLMLEVPRELTVTARLTRHIEHGEGWRQALALWFASTLLDAFDPRGIHR